jgi:hypothetical protein
MAYLISIDLPLAKAAQPDRAESPGELGTETTSL